MVLQRSYSIYSRMAVYAYADKWLHTPLLSCIELSSSLGTTWALKRVYGPDTIVGWNRICYMALVLRFIWSVR